MGWVRCWMSCLPTRNEVSVTEIRMFLRRLCVITDVVYEISTLIFVQVEGWMDELLLTKVYCHEELVKGLVELYEVVS